MEGDGSERKDTRELYIEDVRRQIRHGVLKGSASVGFLLLLWCWMCRLVLKHNSISFGIHK